MALDEAAVLSGRVDGLDGTGNLLVHGQHILLYQAADAAVLPEDLLSVGALLVLGGHGGAQGLEAGCRAQDGQWSMGWAGGQGGLLQDEDHLLLQTVEGLMQAGQHPLVVVLVVQCSRLHSQHVLVVQGIELPEAAHIFLLRLVPLLVCGEKLWKTPTASTSPVPALGQGSEGEGWERVPGQAGGQSLEWLHCDTGMLLIHSAESQGPQTFAWLLGDQAGLSSMLPTPRIPTRSRLGCSFRRVRGATAILDL